MRTSIVHFEGDFLERNEGLHVLSSLVMRQQPDNRVGDEKKTIPVVVVSALADAKTLFHAMITHAMQDQSDKWNADLDVFRSLHLKEVIGSFNEWYVSQRVEEACHALRQDLSTFPHDKEEALLAAWRIYSWGERLAVILMASALRAQGIAAVAIEEPLIHIEYPFSFEEMVEMFDESTEPGVAEPLDEMVLFEKTSMVVQHVLVPLVQRQKVAVVSGTWCHTEDGTYVALDSKDSCSTATLLSEMMQATHVDLYTRTGKMSVAHQPLCVDPPVLPFLTYQEAWQMAVLGATPFHPTALLALARQNTPLFLHSLYRPEPDVLIAPFPQAGQKPAGVLVAQNQLVLCTLKRLWNEQRDKQDTWPFPLDLSMVLRASEEPYIILLRSSPTSLSFVTHPSYCEDLPDWLLEASDWELEISQNIALCTCISAEIAHHPLTAASALSALATVGIKIIASSFHDEGFSLLVEEHEEAHALQVLSQELQEVFILSSACPADHTKKRLNLPKLGDF